MAMAETASMSGGEKIFRHPLAQAGGVAEARLDVLRPPFALVDERQHAFVDLELDVRVHEEELDHAGVAKVVSEFAVGRADAVAAGEFVRLEIDVVVAERLRELRENALRADEQAGERAVEVEEHDVAIVVVRLAV